MKLTIPRFFYLLVCVIFFYSCYPTEQVQMTGPTNPLEHKRHKPNKKITVYSTLEGIDTPYTIIKTIFVINGEQEIEKLKQKGIEIGADAIVLSGSSSTTNIKTQARSPSVLEILIDDEDRRNDTQTVVDIQHRSYSKAIAVIYKHNLSFVNNIPKIETLYKIDSGDSLASFSYYNPSGLKRPTSIHDHILYFSSTHFTTAENNKYWVNQRKKNQITRQFTPPSIKYWYEVQSILDENERVQQVKLLHPMHPQYLYTKTDTHHYHYVENSDKVAYRILEFKDFETLKEVWIYEDDKLLGKDYFNEDGEKIFYSKVYYYQPEDFD